MNARVLPLVVFLVLLLVVSLFLIYNLPSASTDKIDQEVYVGIDVAYDNQTITDLIDKVSSYTNLFVVGCTAITLNQTRLDSICQYIYDKGMSFIIYQDTPIGYYEAAPMLFNQIRPSNATVANASLGSTRIRPSRLDYSAFVSNWTQTAKNKWGNRFLGFYYVDEPAGRQLDQDPEWTVVRNATDYTDASNKFNRAVNYSINWFRSGYTNGTDLSLFTSDYALYHFDYKAGYDVLLAQLGWNYSRQLNIALARGAATVQNKDWGVIVAWEYTQPPYLESSDKLYNDLVLAYTNGAKYIVIFDSNQGYTQSVLTEDHLQALERFWQYIKENPRASNQVNERVGFVLPKDYAYGFRGPEDKIWGLWKDEIVSLNVSISLNSKLEQYSDKLDIIYDEIAKPETLGYKQLFYWNT